MRKIKKNSNTKQAYTINSIMICAAKWLFTSSCVSMFILIIVKIIVSARGNLDTKIALGLYGEGYPWTNYWASLSMIPTLVSMILVIMVYRKTIKRSIYNYYRCS